MKRSLIIFTILLGCVPAVDRSTQTRVICHSGIKWVFDGWAVGRVDHDRDARQWSFTDAKTLRKTTVSGHCKIQHGRQGHGTDGAK